MTKTKINNHFFRLFLIFIVFGVVFYDFISYTYTDELLVLLLVVLGVFSNKTGAFLRPTKALFAIYFLLFIFGFYIAYSLRIRSNTTTAILLDATLQIKPYLAFFVAFLIAPELSGKQKAVIKKWVMCCFVYCVAVVGYGILHSDIEGTQGLFFGHPSRFATSTTILALSCLYVSRRNRKDVIISIMMLTFGFFSGKSKFFGFWGLFVFLMLFYKHVELKLNFKTIFLSVLLFCLVFLLAQEKFNYYFVEGMENDFARSVLYTTAIEVLKTDVPFGSGLGSFATYTSAEYYSPAYYRFQIDTVHGLTPDEHSFIADTFFPALAEFGIAGVFLFSYFWYSVLKQATFYKKYLNRKFLPEYLLVMLVFFFFMIESVADSTFTHNRGVFMMILLGMCLADLKRMYGKHASLVRQNINYNTV